MRILAGKAGRKRHLGFRPAVRGSYELQRSPTWWWRRQGTDRRPAPVTPWGKTDD